MMAGRWVHWHYQSLYFTIFFYCLLHTIMTVTSYVPQKSAKHDGELYLGGLVPIHTRGEKTFCGPINKDRGIQRLEAMMFAIDRINNDSTLLPGIQLGALILDTCSLDTYALNQSLEFIRASISTLDATGFECKDGRSPTQKNQTVPIISGVIGASITSVSMQVANLLRLFSIPQISPASTGEPLSDKSRFDFFARTVPPDNYQAKTLVDIVQYFNWSYVSTVASGGQYGEAGIDSFHKEARARNICIAIAEKVPRTVDRNTYEQILKNLQKKPTAKGVILFLNSDDARGILEAIQRNKMKEPFTYIASDGWGSQAKLVEGVEDAADGAFTVELESRHIPEFDEYISTLTPFNNKRNPWFEEFWEEFFSCSLRDDANLYVQNLSSKPLCSETLRLDEKSGFNQESKVQFVINAVYAMAHALHNLYKDACPQMNGVCQKMREYNGGELFRKYILNVSFIDMAGSEVKFDRSGDGLGSYNIFNYQKTPNGGTTYKLVGKWLYALQIETEDMRFGGGSEVLPQSVCSKPCENGEMKIMQQGETCCWVCQKCQLWEYLADEFTCVDCGNGWWPYPDKLSCHQLPEEYMKWNTLFAIIPSAISAFGVLLTAIVIGLFIKHNDTPIVKASGRELSYMLLGGILFCYFNSIVLLAKPTRLICGLQRFLVGFSFSIVYGALLTKTNRISRIFDSASRSAKRPSFISPKSQVIITLILISVQVIGTVVWLVIEVPDTRQYFPDGRRDRVILKCRIEDSSFLVSLVYNMFLITTCTVYAVKTRKIPENFNESKFIGFTMYTTCIIWLAFIPIYFGTGNSYEIQITTLCVSISLSATVALVCLYSPKIYIIVFHPDKNVRKLTMNSATYKKAPTSSTCATSANHGTGGSAEQVKLTDRSVAVVKPAVENEQDSLTSI
ncbi:hypothetical protein CHUAL_013385 [Chamberlinius hualienensis]